MNLGLIGDDTKLRISIASVTRAVKENQYMLVGVKKQNWFMKKFFNKQKEYVVMCFIQANGVETIKKSSMLKQQYFNKYTKIHLMTVNLNDLIWEKL